MITFLMPTAQHNVLIDPTGHARITDIVPEEQGYTMRWDAPEIMNTGEKHSKETDIFSFAMVMVEVGHQRYILCRFRDILIDVGLYWKGPFQRLPAHGSYVHHTAG